MKRSLLVVLLICGIITTGNACDVCGCAANNQYLGILPGYFNSFVGVQYQYSSFHSTVPSLFEGKPDDVSDEYFHSIRLWGRYSLSNRVQLFAFVPYRLNNFTENGVAASNSGIGDISALANVVLVRKDDASKDKHQVLLAGGGIKLPTGSNTGISTLDKEGLPNIQPGTGSWDFIMNANYTQSRKRFGFNIDASYTLTTANKYDYKYGSRFSGSALAFYRYNAGKFGLIPQAGLRYEYTLHDYDNFSRKWLNEQSGGYMCFALAGAQVFYKKIGAQLTCGLPLAQSYGSGMVTAKPQIESGLFFLF